MERNNKREKKWRGGGGKKETQIVLKTGGCCTFRETFPLLFVSSILKERPRYLLTFDGATIACLPMYAMHPRVTHRIARTTHRVYIYIYVCVRARGVVNSRIDN